MAELCACRAHGLQGQRYCRRVMQSGSLLSQHCGHELCRKVFLVQEQHPEEFCWAALGPSGSPKTNMGNHLDLRSSKCRNTFSDLGEMPHWKLPSWHGRKPVVRIQWCPVNPELNCQAEHCFPFHIPALRLVFPLHSHTSDSITAITAAFRGI